MGTRCKRCGQAKDWNGDDPKCPFTTGNTFGQNWNCGLINKLRDLCQADYVYCEDQKYATLNIDAVEVNGEGIGLALWVTWYKNRGATDAVWILDSYGPPREPTYAELKAIVEHLTHLQTNTIRPWTKRPIR